MLLSQRLGEAKGAVGLALRGGEEEAGSVSTALAVHHAGNTTHLQEVGLYLSNAKKDSNTHCRLTSEFTSCSCQHLITISHRVHTARIPIHYQEPPKNSLHCICWRRDLLVRQDTEFHRKQALQASPPFALWRGRLLWKWVVRAQHAYCNCQGHQHVGEVKGGQSDPILGSGTQPYMGKAGDHCCGRADAIYLQHSILIATMHWPARCTCHVVIPSVRATPAASLPSWQGWPSQKRLLLCSRSAVFFRTSTRTYRHTKRRARACTHAQRHTHACTHKPTQEFPAIGANSPHTDQSNAS